MNFYGQFNIPVDEFIYNRYFIRNGREGTGIAIECGAFDGLTECSCKFFEESLKWKTINVEPSPVIFSKLESNRPNSINFNAALSNTAGTATFRGVIHPVYGELCTNGSLNHTEAHMDALISSGCTFKDYNVNVITYPDLIQRCSLSKVDLFVLDVEGHEMKVIESMKNSSVLPEVFVVEHGQLDKSTVINAVESLGYKYDVSLYVNSFFIRADLIEMFQQLNNIESKDYLEQIKKIEKYFDEGRIIDNCKCNPEFKSDSAAFALLSLEKLANNKICLYSVSGIEGMNCDDQEVFYRLTDSKGQQFLFKPVLQPRPDYAAWRGDLYLNAGNRLIFDRQLLSDDRYKVEVIILNGEYYLVNDSWDFIL